MLKLTLCSKANEYARSHGLRQFCVYQGRWSAASRDFEREIIPMAREEGMALAPWGSLGSGAFKTTEQRRLIPGRQIAPKETEIAISKTLEYIGNSKGVPLTSVALAYVMHKAPYVFPVLGGRTVEHLRCNIEALSLKLEPEDIRQIESAVPFDLGFPHNLLWGREVPDTPEKVGFLDMGGTHDYVAPKKVLSCVNPSLNHADIRWIVYRSGGLGP